MSIDTTLLAPFVVQFVHIFFELMYWSILLYVIWSWIGSTQTGFGDVLRRLVQPIVAPFRWARIGLFDFAPICAMIVVRFSGVKIEQLLMAYLG